MSSYDAWLEKPYVNASRIEAEAEALEERFVESDEYLHAFVDWMNTAHSIEHQRMHDLFSLSEDYKAALSDYAEGMSDYDEPEPEPDYIDTHYGP